MESRAELVDNALAIAEAEFLDRARKSLLAFTLYTKPDYEVNWHHRELCETLDRFATGEIRRLIVSMPPRHGKSELVSRRLPAFILGIKPDTQIISTSYGADLASRLNRDVQRIIESPAYAKVFPNTSLNGDRASPQSRAIRNSDIFEIVNRQGVYRSAGVGGAITGMGANFAIIDDPIKNQEEADSETYREKVWEWYTSTLFTRLEKEGSVLITMTRWHEDDLVGRILSKKQSEDGSQWTVVKLPAIRETDGDDKRNSGDPLWPSKYDKGRLEEIKSAVGSRVWNALYQQRPSAMEGGLIKRHWIRFYSEPPKALEECVQSWDAAFKDGDTSDFVVGQAWGRKGANKYLLAEARARMDITETMRAIATMSLNYPDANAKYIEDKANGPAIVQLLHDKIPGIVPVTPEGSKESRLSAVAPDFEAGNVYLPHPDKNPWVLDYIEELVNFPNAAHDDRVDATSQALIRLRTIDPKFYEDIGSYIRI